MTAAHNRTKAWWLTAISLFVGFQLLLVGYVDRPLSIWLRQVDVEHGAFVDAFRFMTDLGLGVWYLVPSGILALGCFVMLRLGRGAHVKLSAELTVKLQRIYFQASYFFTGVALAGIITNIIKRLVGRSRPKLLDQQDIYAAQPFYFHSDWNAWPSGHATNMFAVAIAFGILFPRWRIPLLAFAALIAVSRVIVNAHFLSDIVAGAVVAALTIMMVTRFYQQRLWLNPK